jgi:outer membrane protein assembly factor BamB
LFPRFGTYDLFFSTTNKVWSLRDDGAGYSVNPNWPATFVANPSTPVFVPGSSSVLVGSSDGHLYQLDAVDPTSFMREKLGDGSGGIGTPTVDVYNSVIYVGSEQGIFYSVVYPLTP